MPEHSYAENLIWQIAELLRGPYRPPQHERIMLPMTVLRRFDCVLASTTANLRAGYDKPRGGRLNDDALDRLLSPPPRPLAEIDAALKRAEDQFLRLPQEVTT